MALLIDRLTDWPAALQRMEDAASGTAALGAAAPAPRLRLYSGHDSTIMPLLAPLQRVDHWPPYLSSLVYELWRRASDGQPYVRVRSPGRPPRASPAAPGIPPRGCCAC